MTKHQRTREGNLLKPTKMCSLENGLWLLRYVERPTPKMIKRWSRKTATNVKKLPHKLKGNAERDIFQTKDSVKTQNMKLKFPCRLSNAGNAMSE